MSLIDSASLIVTPNAYKEGTLYSVIPSDGSGDLSVTRATTATRVNSAGLVELVPYNLLQYSEDLSNAIWGKTDVTITSNAITAPNGTLTADKISSSVNGTLSVYADQYVNGATPINVTHTYSIYAKAGEVTQMLFYMGYLNGIYFNLTNGAFISYYSGAQDIVSYSSENVGNGWYRYNVTLSSNDGTLLILFPAQGGSLSFPQTIGNGFYVWGAQLNEGTLKDYQKTETRLNIPRLDYSNGTCPSILVEPQRTNLLTYSSSFSNAAWVKFNASISANVTATLDPSGNYGASKIVEDSSSAFHDIDQVQTYSAGANTISVYAKSAGRNHIFLQHFDGSSFLTSGTFNLSNGTVSGNGNIESVGNGWYRCSFTATTVNGTGKSYINLSNGTSGNYQGDGTSGVYIWGAQLEVGSYATSYIPTTSASVTRNADVISKTGISSLIGQTEGTIFWDINVDILSASGHEDIFNIDNGAFGNTMYLIKNANATFAAEVYNASSVQCSFINIPITAVGRYKLALAYKTNDFAFYVNGVLVGSDTSGSVGAMSRIQLGQTVFGPSTGYTNAAALWKTRLSNDELERLTGVGFNTYTEMANYYNYITQ